MAEAQRRGEPGQTKSDLARSEPFGSTFVGPFPTDLGQESSIGSFYRSDDEEWQAPPPIADSKTKTDVKLGNHSDLLKTVSDAIKVFQDDLATLNIDHRVAGMTYSEFGRQIASNASLGTDHGDAAPLFLFVKNVPVIS